MTLMLKILQAVGILLGIILLVVLWVIVMPRHFWVEYSKADGPLVKMNIGPFKLRLFPLPDFIQKKMAEKQGGAQKDKKEKTQKKEKPLKKEKPREKTVAGGGKTQSPRQRPRKKQPEQPQIQQQQDKTEKEKKNPFADIQFSLDLVKQVVAAAKGIMAKIFKAIKFRDVSFTVPIHGADAMKTQQTYGIVTNSFYTLAVFLQKHLQITFKSPIFVADFADSYKDSIYFYCQITASPVLLLAAGWFAYRQYNQIMENNKKSPATPEGEK